MERKWPHWSTFSRRFQQHIQSRIERMERSLWGCKACDWLTAESLLDVFPSGDASLSLCETLIFPYVLVSQAARTVARSQTGCLLVVQQFSGRHRSFSPETGSESDGCPLCGVKDRDNALKVLFPSNVTLLFLLEGDLVPPRSTPPGICIWWRRSFLSNSAQVDLFSPKSHANVM